MTRRRWMGWAVGLAVVLPGVACTPSSAPTQPAPKGKQAPVPGKPEPASSTPSKPGPASSTPFVLDGPYGVRQSIFTAGSIPCGSGMCGSWWNDSRPHQSEPGVDAARPILERSCGRLVGPGLLLTAHEREVETLVEEGDQLVWRETRAVAGRDERATTRTLPLGSARDIQGGASRGPGRFVLTKSEGSLALFPEGTTVRAPRADEKLFGYTVDSVWAFGDEILFVESGGRTDPRWVVHRVGSGRFDTIAQGHVGHCGRPLFDGKAVALHGQSEVVVLATQKPGPPRVLAGNPLEESTCASGDDDLIAVTGRHRGLPAVAIHDARGWQVVHFRQQPSHVSAFVKDGRVVVSLPEERVLSLAGSEPVPAGAVYLLGRRTGQWIVEERVTPAQPGDHGLFGFAVDFNEEGLFINQMVPGALYASDGGMDGIGRPMLCYLPWN